jgi:hypothetical protein
MMTQLQPAPVSAVTVSAGIHMVSADQPLATSLQSVAASGQQSSNTVRPVYVLPSAMSVPRESLVPVRLMPDASPSSVNLISQHHHHVQPHHHALLDSQHPTRFSDSPAPSLTSDSSSSMKDSPPRSPSLLSIASTTSPLATSSSTSSSLSSGQWSPSSLSLPSVQPHATSFNPLRASRSSNSSGSSNGHGSSGGGGFMPRSGMFLAAVFAFAFLFQFFGLYTPSTTTTATVSSPLVTQSAAFHRASAPHFTGRVLLSTSDNSVDANLNSDLPVILFDDMSSPSATTVDSSASSSSSSSTPADALVAALHLLLLQPDVALAQVKAHTQVLIIHSFIILH